MVRVFFCKFLKVEVKECLSICKSGLSLRLKWLENVGKVNESVISVWMVLMVIVLRLFVIWDVIGFSVIYFVYLKEWYGFVLDLNDWL